MQLNKLYEIQAGLKAHIDYKGEDKFSRMMLAMIVEFGECANDWQQFKYWKKNNEPKVKDEMLIYGMPNKWVEYNPLLVEYVDGLHFILEAGLDLVEMGSVKELPSEMSGLVYPESRTITKQFKVVMYLALELDASVAVGDNHLIDLKYYNLFKHYLALGHMLGFTEEQIENAYMEKNKENHERQQRNY